MKYSCQFSVTSFNLEDFEKVDRKIKELLQNNASLNLKVSGPMPLQRTEKLFTVNSSPHGNKKARDQFFLTHYKRLWVFNVEGLKQHFLYSKLLWLFNELGSLEALSLSWKISLKKS